jgi:hypothetical protein
MLVKHLITAAALAAATATSAAPALAGAETKGATTAHAAAAGIKWTPDQLQALANAYRAKNPGWSAPVTSGVQFPADMTWTSENLDHLANAYAALNPGWTRPGPAGARLGQRARHLSQSPTIGKWLKRAS